jgi:glutamate:GABA antiporter
VGENMQNKKTMGSKGLIIFCITAIVALRWCPITAKYGAATIFLWITAGVIFFIPFSLIISELSCLYPDERGGLVVWIKNEFGERTAFIISFFYFISCLLALPTVLTFSASSLAYAFFPSLMTNKLYLTLFIIIGFGISVLLNFYGIDKVKKIVDIVGPLGSILPGMIVIVAAFGAVFFFDRPSATTYSISTMIPKIHFNNIMFLSVLAFAMAGIEMISAFVYKIKNPKKTIPFSIVIAAILIATFYIIASVAITLIIPPEKINIATAFVQVFEIGLQSHILAKIVALLIAIGGIGLSLVWSIGPVKAFIDGNSNKILPKFLTDKDQTGDVPKKGLIFEFVIIVCVCMMTYAIPNFESVYTIFIQITTITYFIPYIFIIAVYLNIRKKKNLNIKSDTFVIPGKTNFLAYLATGVTFFTLSLSLIFAFFPPSHLHNVSDKINYVAVLIISNILLFLASYFFYSFKKGKLYNKKKYTYNN